MSVRAVPDNLKRSLLPTSQRGNASVTTGQRATERRSPESPPWCIYENAKKGTYGGVPSTTVGGRRLPTSALGRLQLRPSFTRETLAPTSSPNQALLVTFREREGWKAGSADHLVTAAAHTMQCSVVRPAGRRGHEPLRPDRRRDCFNALCRWLVAGPQARAKPPALKRRQPPLRTSRTIGHNLALRLRKHKEGCLRRTPFTNKKLARRSTSPRGVPSTARKQGWNVLQTLEHPDPMLKTLVPPIAGANTGYTLRARTDRARSGNSPGCRRLIASTHCADGL